MSRDDPCRERLWRHENVAGAFFFIFSGLRRRLLASDCQSPVSAFALPRVSPSLSVQAHRESTLCPVRAPRSAQRTPASRRVAGRKTLGPSHFPPRTVVSEPNWIISTQRWMVPSPLCNFFTNPRQLASRLSVPLGPRGPAVPNVRGIVTTTGRDPCRFHTEYIHGGRPPISATAEP
jgi:hypothetical protein